MDGPKVKTPSEIKPPLAIGLLQGHQEGLASAFTANVSIVNYTYLICEINPLEFCTHNTFFSVNFTQMKDFTYYFECNNSKRFIFS
jgi:hypothetical protein